MVSCLSSGRAGLGRAENGYNASRYPASAVFFVLHLCSWLSSKHTLELYMSVCLSAIPVFKNIVSNIYVCPFF